MLQPPGSNYSGATKWEAAFNGPASPIETAANVDGFNIILTGGGAVYDSFGSVSPSGRGSLKRDRIELNPDVEEVKIIVLQGRRPSGARILRSHANANPDVRIVQA